MASNIKVDIVRPTATNGSLSLKGDSGGSATTNGITVNSSGNTSITGTTTISGGTIDGTTIGGTTPAAGSFTQVNAGDGAEATPSITNTGDTNTGIYFPTADTVGVSTGGSERLRINSSGNVGIGTVSTNEKVHTEGSYLASNGSNVSTTTVGFKTGRRRSSLASVIENDGLGFYKFQGWDGSNYIEAASITAWVDGTPGTNDMPGRLVFSTTADNASSPTERMRIDSSGNVELKTTNAKLILPSGGGIDFGTSTTGSGTVTPTVGGVLDDYEEGTWTPTNNGDATGVLLNPNGNYIKIGRFVMIVFNFNVSTSFTAFQIGGLPFTPSGSGFSYGTLGYGVYGSGDKYWRIDNGSSALTSVTSANANTSVATTRCALVYQTNV